MKEILLITALLLFNAEQHMRGQGGFLLFTRSQRLAMLAVHPIQIKQRNAAIRAMLRAVSPTQFLLFPIPFPLDQTIMISGIKKECVPWFQQTHIFSVNASNNVATIPTVLWKRNAALIIVVQQPAPNQYEGQISSLSIRTLMRTTAPVTVGTHTVLTPKLMFGIHHVFRNDGKFFLQYFIGMRKLGLCREQKRDLSSRLIHICDVTKY